eukprot:gene8020-10868_t
MLYLQFLLSSLIFIVAQTVTSTNLLGFTNKQTKNNDNGNYNVIQNIYNPTNYLCRGNPFRVSSSLLNLLTTKSTENSKKSSKKVNKSHSKTNKIKVIDPKADDDVNETSDNSIFISNLTKEEYDNEIKKQKMFDTLQQIGFSMLSMIVSRKIFKLDFKNNAQNVTIGRIIFCGYLLFIQLLEQLLLFIIKKKDDNQVIDLENPIQIPSSIKEMIPPQFSHLVNIFTANVNNNNEKKTITIKEYDIEQTKKLFSNNLFEVMVVSYLHFVNKSGAPLLLFPLMGIINKLKSPIIQIHLFGFKAVGDLVRPFKSSFERMLGMNNTEKLSESSTINDSKVDQPVDVNVDLQDDNLVKSDIIDLDEDQELDNNEDKIDITYDLDDNNLIKEEINVDDFEEEIELDLDNNSSSQ